MADLIILGGGPAGYNAAERAAEGGLSVILFEKRAMGGVCLNEGCIPSKALLNSAKIYNHARHGEAFGVFADGMRMEHDKVIARKEKVVSQLVGGIRAKMKAAGVQVVAAEAVITGRDDAGFHVTAQGENYTAARLLICTGSEPILPPIEGLREAVDSGFGLTNREVLSLPEVPARLCIVGGGVIGLEMASYYRAAGAEVSVVEMLDAIGGPLDKEIAAGLRKALEKTGIVFYTGCAAKKFEEGRVHCEKAGEAFVIECDKVLLSIGRRAVTKGYGLETLNPIMERGHIVTDEYLRTNIPGLYAAGDVNGVSMLAHTAYREGEVAVNHMLGKRDRMRYDAIPAVIYTDPEVAQIGMTADAAEKAGLKVKCVKLPLSYSGRYIAENERGEGFVKLVAEEGTRRILGVQMLGTYASEIIWGAASLIETEMTVEDVRELVFPHPTVGEVIREGMFHL